MQTIDADPDLIAALAADLDGAGFRVSRIADLWGDEADRALHRSQRVPALRALDALAAPSRTGTLARLFLLADPRPAREVEDAVPGVGVAGLERLGLVAVDAAGMVSPAVDLRPYDFVDAAGAGSWWIASDLGELTRGGALPEDHVLGIGGATTTLSGLMLTGRVRSVLDLGTGSGIQAMHAARSADRVVATDISERALRFAAFNLALNGIDTVELRLGSLYEPVAGERFDRIVSNPPFVITPRSADVPAYEYRDGGMEGDGIVEAVVTGAAAHLEPGGVLQMLGNWETIAGVGGLDRVAGWAGAGERPLEHWVVERELQDPAEYAETWIRDGGTLPGDERFDALVAAWLDDFERRGVRQIGFGSILLRDRDVAGRVGHAGSAPRLARAERLHGPAADRGGLGAHLADSLAGWDAQAGADDAALLAMRLRVAPDVTEERHYWPGAADPTVMTLVQGAGYGRRVPVDTALAAVVGASDGDLTLGAIVDAVAAITGTSPADLAAAVLPGVRALLGDAMLLPDADATADGDERT